MSQPHSLAFIGCGQMATALAKGWRAAGLYAIATGSDPVEAACSAFRQATGITTGEMQHAVMNAETIILAVKPQSMPAVFAELKPLLVHQPLVISIAAGITLHTLQAGLGDIPLVRVMPNTPCLVGASATGYAMGHHTTASHRERVAKLFGTVGVAFELPEKLLDAVTGLSGSGPAYVYLMIEALADGGVKCGLPRDVALKLAAQTVMGAAKMVLETGQHPAVLKDAVTSPGGTTIAGLQVLENANTRAAFLNAVEAAAKRAAELGMQKV